ncbi:hypothetical protein CGLO_14569 [Colletotrichum gloeosporioides Cg-14]|uniref:AB hydrolase-1 domain-containing protein n=1 Tax=Colletotrichum gloeosporioides (strain Cg-14) TaxID=1237896 RepID=T0K3P1_COLGC|nr:hypothetical protein CGLO_14569 [Colletotrichum gloeosporioides Cg-14]
MQAVEGLVPFHHESFPSDFYSQTRYKIIGDRNSDHAPLIVLHRGPRYTHHYLKPTFELFARQTSTPVIFYDQIGLDGGFSLYGHSWGAMLALKYVATCQPQGLQKIVLGSGPASMAQWKSAARGWISALPPRQAALLEEYRMGSIQGSTEADHALEELDKLTTLMKEPFPRELQVSLDWLKEDDTVLLSTDGPNDLCDEGNMRDLDAQEINDGVPTYSSTRARSWFRSVSVDTSAAAWIGLFAEIGLDRVELNLVDMGSGLRSVTADYLPDDIVAAPAYAELGIIVSLLATTGVSFGAVDGTSRYPTIVGRGFQFDFRQHPTLGVVGAYSRHERKDKRTATPDLKAIRMALLNGNGIIYTAGGLLLARDESEYGPIYTTVHGSQVRYGLNLLRPSRFERKIISTHMQKVSNRHFDKLDSFPPGQNVIPSGKLPVVSLFLAGTPDHPPAIFPNSTLGRDHDLTALALNGSYWPKVLLSETKELKLSQWLLSSDPPSWSHFVWFNFSIPDRTTADSPEELAKIARVVQWAFDDKKLRVKEARNLEYRKAEQITKNKHKAEEVAKMTAKLAQGRNQRQAMLKAQRAAEETALAEKIKAEASAALHAADLESKEPIKGYLLVLQLCLKLLHSPQKLRQWFFKFPLGLQKALRWVVLQQMKDVDKWLQDSGRDDVEFRAVVVCSTTLLLLRAEEMANNVQDCSPGTNSSWCRFDGHGSGQVTTHTANQLHCRHDTARCKHSKTLQSLANLVKSFNQDENIYEALNPP